MSESKLGLAFDLCRICQPVDRLLRAKTKLYFSKSVLRIVQESASLPL